MNAYVRQEQQRIERFVRAEYWRLAKLKDGRFSKTRAPFGAAADEPGERE